MNGRADYVDQRAIIRLRVAHITRITAAHGASIGGRTRRISAGVIVIVTGSKCHEVTPVNHVVSSIVEGLAEAPAQAATDYHAIGTISVGAIFSNKVPRCDEVRVLEAILGVEDLDSVDLDLLGDSIGFRANGASAVGTVAQIIYVGASYEALNLMGTTFKLL